MIKFLMKAYRNSRFHNARNGRILAGMLAFFHKLQGRHTSVIKEIRGVIFELDLSQVIDSSLYYSGSFEPKCETIIARYLQPGMCVLDIGANMGYHTLPMAKIVASSGWVHAIEPTAWAVTRLKRNLALNPALENVSVHQLALSDESSETQEIHVQASYRLDGQDLPEVECMRVLRLDDFVHHQKISRVDFIKMDVDGHEGRIFNGASETILKHHPLILFEFNPQEIIRTGCKPKDLLKFLKDMGYLLFDDDLKSLDDRSLAERFGHAAQSSMILAVWEKSSINYNAFPK